MPAASSTLTNGSSVSHAGAGGGGSGEGENHSAMLLECVREGRVDVLRSILAELANKPYFHEAVDSIASNDGTLLHTAVSLGSVDCVRTLLSAGVNPCVQNDEGQTALQRATSEDIKSAFVQELLQAVAQSKLGRLCQLLSAGVPIDAVDSPKSGNTALHYAASYSSDDVIRTLCESGAHVNKANAKGETALHDAVYRTSGSDVIVRRLLQFGADPTLKNADGLDCYKLAEVKNKQDIMQILSMHSVQRTVQRSASVESELDRSSIYSTESFLVSPRKPSVPANQGQIESWTDLLWPQPRHLMLDQRNRRTKFPTDNRLKIYFHSASDGEPRRLMQILHVYLPLLNSCQLELEYRGHRVADQSPVEGKVTVGIFDQSQRKGSYTLSIEEKGIELFADEYTGIRYGFATLTQILRIHRQSGEGDIPCLTIRDYPDMAVRAVYEDFSGCKTLTIDTLLSLATRMGYCKANYLFVNFEVRTTDRYQLPYTNRELFHLTQVCDELFVTLVPSLDLNSSYIDANAAKAIIDRFLDDFPLSKVAHFGPNLTSILIEHRAILDAVQKRAKKLYLSLDVDDRNGQLVDSLPPYVTLCVEGRYPLDIEAHLSPKINVVLKFATSDVGYLCQAPESTVRNAVLAAKLGEKVPIHGTMICELSTGCEIMPPSLAYVPEIATLGVSWNRDVDMKRFCYLLPRITAEHVLLDGKMTALFQQAMTLGRVEHELTKLGAGLLRTGSAGSPSSIPNGVGPKKPPISVFVEMILNPDNMTLERLTPVAFKKSRIELRRSLKALDEARKELPYNFELALVLAEIQLVSELMALASRLGQALCIHGGNPTTTGDHHVGLSTINVGVANLPLTVRTDLANSLLEIRSKFQHTWLSRNIPSTLPNALKIFDNLFRALLPPSMQDYSKNLL